MDGVNWMWLIIGILLGWLVLPMLLGGMYKRA